MCRSTSHGIFSFKLATTPPLVNLSKNNKHFACFHACRGLKINCTSQFNDVISAEHVLLGNQDIQFTNTVANRWISSHNTYESRGWAPFQCWKLFTSQLSIPTSEILLQSPLHLQLCPSFNDRNPSGKHAFIKFLLSEGSFQYSSKTWKLELISVWTGCSQ